jgi:tRNA (guanosine-2'-O-)-methyltransferase
MTPKRFQRIKQVLLQRQLDLTVLLDNVHKPHNLSAIVRNCDAVGIHRIHAVTKLDAIQPRKYISSGTAKWVAVDVHPDLQTAQRVLKQQNMQILAAHPDQEAIDYRDIDYTQSTAVMLGAELDGVCDTGLVIADQHIMIPMLGMIDSLNVSVAAALILFEAQRQRLKAGCYEQSLMNDNDFRKTLFEWSHPKQAELYSRHSLEYPELDEDGQIIESAAHTRARLGKQSVK